MDCSWLCTFHQYWPHRVGQLVSRMKETSCHYFEAKYDNDTTGDQTTEHVDSKTTLSANELDAVLRSESDESKWKILPTKITNFVTNGYPTFYELDASTLTIVIYSLVALILAFGVIAVLLFLLVLSKRRRLEKWTTDKPRTIKV